MTKAVTFLDFGRDFSQKDYGLTRMMAERVQRILVQRISGAVAQSARLNMLPAVADEMAFRLSADFHALPLVKVNYDFKAPLDWWQAVKERWFPRWALLRWPVEYREGWCHFTQYGPICPHIEGDPHARHFEWMAYGPRPPAPDIHVPENQ